MWFGVHKGMLSVKHLATQIHMAVDYCGRQLGQTLGGRPLPTFKMKVQPCILESTNIACSVMGGMMGVAWHVESR